MKLIQLPNGNYVDPKDVKAIRIPKDSNFIIKVFLYDGEVEDIKVKTGEDTREVMENIAIKINGVLTGIYKI